MSERAEIEVPQADLHAYVDGQLTPARRRIVEAWLAGHPMIAATLDGWQAQNASIRQLFAEETDGAQAAADWRRIRILRARQARPKRRPRWIAPAAAAVIFALGALVGGGASLWSRAAPAAAPLALPALTEASREVWLLYGSEIVHPVEVGARHEAQLVEWLGRRLDAPFAAPDLARHGLRLIGGRLVPFGDAPGAVLLYEDGAGGRLSALVARDPSGPANSGFSVDVRDGVATVSWSDAGLGYALTAAFPRAHLLDLAAAYRQQS